MDRVPRFATPKDEIDFLLASFRASGRIVTVEMTITPDFAQHLLLVNDGNRPISWLTVDRYANDMKKGRWRLNGEAIVISDDGRLNTGQHRALACLRAGVSFPSIVIVGIPRDARHTDGQGLQKTPSHRLAMRGHKNGDLLSKTASLVLALKCGQLDFSPKARSVWLKHRPPSHLELVEYAEARQDDILRAAKLYKSVRAMDVRRMTALAVYLHDNGANWETIAAFFEALLTGANLKKDCPVFALRRRLIDNAEVVTPAQFFELMLRTWNYWRTGTKATKSLPIVGSLPDVIV